VLTNLLDMLCLGHGLGAIAFERPASRHCRLGTSRETKMPK
jgi:hypothetical protein